MKRIKKYSWKWIVIGLTVAILFVVPFVVGAEDNNVFDEPISEKVAGIELAIRKWDLSHYVPITNTDDSSWFDSKIVDGMNNMSGFFFSLTKLVAQIIDTGISYLYSLDAVNLMADKVANISKILWDNLYASFGTLFFLLAALQIFFIFSVKRNSQEAMKRAFSLFLVIGLSVVWFSNTGWYMKAINNVTNEVQGVVMKAGTAFTTGTDEKIEKGKELDGSLAIMRNAYFELIVEKPYLMMNYGTPNKEEILQDDANRIDDLLMYRLNDEGLRKKEEIINDEIDKYENMNMTSSNVANQMGVAFISFLFALILGIPLLLVAFLNLLLQILGLALSIVLPVTIMLSFLPSFVNSGWNTLAKLLGVFMMKAFVGMVILFVFLVINIINAIIPATNTGMYFLNLIAIACSIVFMILCRNQLIKLFTGGMVAKVDNSSIPEKALEGVKNKIKNRGKSDEREEINLDDEDLRNDIEESPTLNTDTEHTNESAVDAHRGMSRTSQIDDKVEVNDCDESEDTEQEFSRMEQESLNDSDEVESISNRNMGNVSEAELSSNEAINEKDSLENDVSDDENIIHLMKHMEARNDRIPQEEIEEVEDVSLYQDRLANADWDELEGGSFDRLPQEEMEEVEDQSLQQSRFADAGWTREGATLRNSYEEFPKDKQESASSYRVAIDNQKTEDKSLRETFSTGEAVPFGRKELDRMEENEKDVMRKQEEKFVIDGSSLREERNIEKDIMD